MKKLCLLIILIMTMAISVNANDAPSDVNVVSGMEWVYLNWTIVNSSELTTLTSDDIDYVCDQNESVLYRNDDVWGCGHISDVITFTNVTVINNKTYYNTSILNLTGDGFVNGNLYADNFIGNVSANNLTDLYYLNDSHYHSPENITSGNFKNGNYTFDTSTLTIDATNNRIGMGTTSPQGALEIKASSPIIYLDGIGYSGWGFQDNNAMRWLNDYGTGATTDLRFVAATGAAGSESYTEMFRLSKDSGYISFSNSNLITSNGKLGIRTSTPDYYVEIYHPSNWASNQFHYGTGTYGIFLGSGTGTGTAPMITLTPEDSNDLGLIVSAVEPADDTGTTAAFRLDSRRTGGVLQTRPLFSLASYGNEKALFNKDGWLGIGTTPTTHLDVAGNITGDRYYGEIYNYSSAGYVLELADTGVYYNITNLTEHSMNGFSSTKASQENGGTYITVEKTGTYLLNAGLSFESTIAAGSLYGFAIAKNFQIMEHRNCYSRREGSGSVGHVGITCITDLTAGDTLNLQIEDETSNRDIEIYTAQLNAVNIGD